VPELPEVEVARRSLEPAVVGRRVRRIEVLKPQALRTHTPAQASKILVGRRITALRRRGKTLLFSLDGAWTMTFHFTLWGLILAKDAVTPDPHTAIVVELDDGRALEFRELSLSSLNLYADGALPRVEYYAKLGVDADDASLTAKRFREVVGGKAAIRNLLTDQSRLAGIGNLWALEILFVAGLRPARKAEALTAEAWGRLHRSTRAVLRRGIRAGGEPEFIDADGRKGRFRLMVYGRGGEPCRACGTRIATGRVGGRPAFWCPTCQR
jgi:formamidopyrimidine-DNA glycosylase